MLRRRITGALAAGAFAALVMTAGLAGGEERPLKQLMGDNFAGLQVILIALINAQYEAVPEQAELIHSHATALTRDVPEAAAKDREQFLFYAYNLQSHAADLKAISELLIEHDKGKANALREDHLREALAAHYGGVVEMCVSCHNRFRQRVVQ
jgi:cytochrome c556